MATLATLVTEDTAETCAISCVRLREQSVPVDRSSSSGGIPGEKCRYWRQAKKGAGSA